MAKKKKTEEDDSKEEKVSNHILSMITSKYGKSGVVNAQHVLDKPQHIFSISPKLDIGLSGGIPEGSWVIISGAPKCGKEQPIYSKVYTPNGYKTIGEIIVGDIVCTPDGNTAKVIDVFDQGEKDVYRVHFNNGDYVDAGLDHLWEVYECKYDQPKIKTTKEIMLNLLYNKKEHRFRYKVATSVCNFNKKENMIHPYVLGCFIGDGGLTSEYGVNFTSADPEIINNINGLLEDGFYLQKINNKKYAYFLKTTNRPNKYKHEINRLNLNVKSTEKYIPIEYLTSSYEDRIDLIQGLMDTNGYVSVLGNKSDFSTSSFRLARDFKNLVQSVGGIVKISKRQTKCDGKTFTSYRCIVKDDQLSRFFRISRKKDRCQDRKKFSLKHTIVNIEKIGKHNCKCLLLDSKDHLYITDNFIRTHNSSLSLSIAALAQKPENGSRNVYYIDAEGRLKKMNLAGTLGLDLEKFTVIQSSQEKLFSAEEFLDIAETIIRNDPGCVLIIDSSSALCSSKEMVDEVSGQTRSITPRIFSSFCKKMGTIVPIQRTTVIVIQHLIANTSGYGPAQMEDGGRKLQYQVDVKLRCKGIEKWEEGSGENKSIIGQLVKWDVICCALGQPGHEVVSYLRYGEGIDKVSELIDVCCDFGLISKGGAWYTLELDGEEPIKMQGLANLRKYLIDNPETLKKLESSYKEML